MDGGLLSLKWNNHRSTFFYVLSNVRKKECYTDVTLACEGKFYPVHKLVLSTCSEYFEQMFEQTQCKHPVIVLKDIRSEELESLLSYMYVGEVNVVQEKLSGLIKAAECLRIKGLAVPDEEPCSKPSTSREKRSSDNSLNSEPKRRRQDDSGNTSSFRQGHSNNRNDDRRKSLDHPSSSNSNKFRNTNSSNSNVNSNRASSGDRESGDRGSISNRVERLSSPASNNQHAATEVKTEDQVEASEAEAPPDEVTIDEPNEPVKQEPVDLDAVYLSDSNSATEAKDILMENFGDSDGQQHFMDELLGQNSGSDQGNMGVGDYGEGGEGSSSAPSGAGGQQQQQHMGFGGCVATTTATSTSDGGDGCRMVMGAGGLVAAVSGTNSRVAGRSGTGSSSSSSRLVSVSSEPWKNPRPHVCTRCGYIARDKTNLRKHMYTHTGEKPYVCRWCSYKTTQSSNLHTHTRRHHPLQAASLVPSPAMPTSPSNYHSNLFSSVRNLQHNFEMQALLERGFGNDSHSRNTGSSGSGGRGDVDHHPPDVPSSTLVHFPNKVPLGLGSGGEQQQQHSHDTTTTASVNYETPDRGGVHGNNTPLEHNPGSDVRSSVELSHGSSGNAQSALIEAIMSPSDSEYPESPS